MSKAREWPRGWQIPGPQEMQNLQMSRSSLGAGGEGRGSWAQLELTDALTDALRILIHCET